MSRRPVSVATTAPQWRYSPSSIADDARSRPRLRLVRRAWIGLASLLLFAILVEASSASVLALNRFLGRANTDDGRRADTYVGAPWVDAYYRELSESAALEWRPYVYFRRKPFSGEFVNVDTQGRRKTWRSLTAMPEGRMVTIYAFGGSTMWGTGARDDFTIPSILARLLRERFGIDARIVNFGETAYVSTQDVITLEAMVRDGSFPDLVLFYGGFNDLFSAYQQGSAGMPQNEFNRAREFNVLRADRRAELAHALVGPSGLRESATFELLSAVLHRLGASGSAPTNAQRVPDELVHDTVAVYRANVRVIEALGAQHGFASLFYWQPTIFDKETLTAYEERKAAEFAFVREMVTRTGAAMNRDPYLLADGNFHDLRRLFAGTTAPLFTDYAHLGETGNALVAERMLADVTRALGTRKSRANGLEASRARGP